MSLAAIFLTSVIISSGGWWPIHPLPGFIASVSVDFTYDSNPFRYSDSDIDLFDRGAYPYRFPFKTRDDLKIRTRLDIRRLKGKVGLRLTLANTAYLSNREKSSVYLGALLKYRSLYLQASYLPDFLIRYYPDYDSGSTVYLPCYYTEAKAEIGIVPLKKPLRITVFGLAGRRVYPDNFREYDTGFLGAGLRLKKKLASTELKVSYTFDKGSARGYDEEGETRENSDDADISYRRHTLALGIDTDFGSFSLALAYRFRSKEFTGNDLWHRDRTDRDNRFSVTVERPLNNRLALSAGYTFEIRSTDSPYSDSIEEVKSYKRHLFGIGFKLTI